MTTNLQLTGLAIPQGSLEAYISAVNGIPILTADEEREYAQRWFHHQDLAAAQKLVLPHLRFVVHIARSYSGYGLPQADLIQEGNIGLMKAVKRFNPEMGVRLVSFAIHWIKAEIHEYVLRNWRIVKVATTKAQRKLFFNLRGAKKKLSWLTGEERLAVAADLGVSESEVLEMESRLAAHDQSFDLANDESEEDVFAPANYLEADWGRPERDLVDGDWDQHSSNQLQQALSTLDERSQAILQARWLDDDNKATLQELADRYQVSAERIRQLENNALKKLRKTMLLEA